MLAWIIFEKEEEEEEIFFLKGYIKNSINTHTHTIL